MRQGKLAATAQSTKLVESITTSLSHSAHAIGPPTTPLYAIVNLGCTAHFPPSTLVCNKQTTTAPIAIHMPSGTILHSTQKANLDLPGLLAAAHHGHVVPQLATQLLISIG